MINYEIGGLELMPKIKPLWQHLSQYHQNVSEYFKEDFFDDKYDLRHDHLQSKSNVHIVLACDNDEPIGYLVSSVHGANGEIDSLFIQQDYRGQAIGETLMMISLDWINSFLPEHIRVSVAVGNQVQSFYEKFGFYPRSMIMKAK